MYIFFILEPKFNNKRPTFYLRFLIKEQFLALNKTKKEIYIWL